ncbi:hypothetical protein [Candidatus Pelagisphaera phototrophica]|uniref:hypothetical protein n=1 Tax=Candidatus Pelagisphaera phototrophica TaxID=2684113 RepID=UPI0019E03484|nr:hypothetical protein [Candidatus Pelagisphaera phototrophica]QXD32842.1 hypothetical protein GA004_03750 [Candidatus Pelagisphaera phototrophica]
MKFLRPAREERIAHIGRLLGVEVTAEAAISEVIRLRRESGLPERLRDVGGSMRISHRWQSQQVCLNV